MKHNHLHAEHKQAADNATLHDPVCGMAVTRKSEHQWVYENSTYYFCSARCQEKFQTAPSQYLRPDAATTQVDVASTSTGYICPMHP